jgi:hypothetical protein
MLRLDVDLTIPEETARIAKAVAVNFKRVMAWLTGQPLALTRRLPFAAFALNP